MSRLVALTGATGFIGRVLLEKLSAADIPVRALYRRHIPSHPDVHWVHGDLNSPAALQTLVEGADAVIHCAGIVRGRSARHFLSVNRDGTANVLRACRKQHGHPRFLLISSLAAREPGLSWYAASKREAEKTLAAGCGSMPWSVFRPTAVYGPGEKELRPLLQAMKAGFLPAPMTDSRFSLLHVNDLAAAVCRWTSVDRVPEGIYELDDGTASGYNWQSLIDLAAQIWKKPVIRIPVPVTLLKILAAANLGLAGLLRYSPMLTPGKVRELAHTDWTCDSAPLNRELGWRPAIRLADAMRDPRLLSL